MRRHRPLVCALLAFACAPGPGGAGASVVLEAPAPRPVQVGQASLPVPSEAMESAMRDAESSAPSEVVRSVGDAGPVAPTDASGPSSLDGGAPASGPPTDPAGDVVPPLPRGTLVLHVGDSFAGALGIELNARLKQHGVRGYLRFETASFIPEWAWQPQLDLLITHHRPDLVLITLGANEVGMTDPTQRVGVIRKLVGRLGDTPCVWVGIPLWGRDNGLMRVIRDHCAPCRFLDTQALVRGMPRLPDGIHPTIPARRRWAAWVVEWLARAREPSGPRPWSLRAQAELPTGPILDFGSDGP